MCGIFGGNRELLGADPARLLRHRGPDQAGHVEVRAADGAPIILGQTRLSVVHRGEVATPMERDGAVIAFNGEIYNWNDLREELEAKGRRFSTPTDTEVVLSAYLEWGPACLDRLNGMFAIAIWADGALFLARDRLGKKPLFYSHGPRGLAFASELKAIRDLEFGEEPLCRSLEFYFDDHTPFTNVKSVRPGEYATYRPEERRLDTRRWWSFPDPEVTITDERQAVREVLEVLGDACRIRRVADVPVTLFLSGGLDSSLIQALLGVPVTYTVQFEEFLGSIDEWSYVSEFAAAAGFEARRVTPTRADFFETFSSLARAIEFPVGSFSVFPLYCLARQARADGFVVALSGEGADELFNGYYRNELLLREEARIASELEGPYSTLSRRYFGTPLERFCRMAARQGLASVPALIERFAPSWREGLSFGQNLSRLEATVFLQPLLVMADRLSMASSLEVRNPFLDHRVVTLSTRLADHLKFRDGQGKWVLRRALEELVGKDLGITKRSVKHGLPAPVNQWLFNSSVFDRKDWNHVLLGECLKELARAHDPEGQLGREP